MTHRAALLLALLSVALAACGVGSAPGMSECPYVSNAEASAALGADAYLRPVEGDAQACSIGSWGTFGGVIMVENPPEHGTGDDYWTTPEYIEGLGDRAAWIGSPPPGLDGEVVVEFGDWSVVVRLVRFPTHPEPDLRGRTEALARAVVANL